MPKFLPDILHLWAIFCIIKYMENKEKIVVLFGPSGSGKSYVADKLCEDPRFFHVKKTSDRPKRRNDISVRHIGGKLYSFNYISEEDVRSSELSFENFGHSYSLNIGDVDRSIISGQIPVIILRAREHFEALAKAYPNFEIEKFYIRPEKELLIKKLSSDQTRSPEQISERISKIEREYEYHDETLALDPSVTLIENDYESDDFLDVIKGKVQPGKPHTLSQSLQTELKNTICFGDKIRISFEPDPNSPERHIWFAKVISGEQLKMDLPAQETLSKLLQMVVSKISKDLPLDVEKSFSSKPTKQVSEILKTLSEKLGQYETSFLGLSFEDKKLVRGEVTNQKTLFEKFDILSVPSVVLDIDVDHLGFKVSLASPIDAPVLQDENFDRKHSARRFDLIGFMPQSQPVRIAALSEKSVADAIEQTVVAISEKYSDADSILFPSDYISDKLIELCLDMPEELVRGLKKFS